MRLNIFKSRDKPRNSTPGQSYGFLFGGTSSGKSVNERSAMQMTAVYACVRNLSEAIARELLSNDDNTAMELSRPTLLFNLYSSWIFGILLKHGFIEFL